MIRSESWFDVSTGQMVLYCYDEDTRMCSLERIPPGLLFGLSKAETTRRIQLRIEQMELNIRAANENKENANVSHPNT